MRYSTALLALLLPLVGARPYVAAAQAAPDTTATLFDPIILGGVAVLYHSSLDVADYDGDGRPDLLVSGTDGEQVRTRVYRYVEEVVEVLPLGAVRITAVYAEAQPSVDIPQVWGGEAIWGDYDGNGEPDVLVTGAQRLAPPYEPVTRLFANRRGALVEVPLATRVLVPVFNSAAAWGDYDADGDPDLVVAGRTADGALRTDLYRNDGNETFTRLAAGFVGIESGDVAWGDADGDGDLDLALVGAADIGTVARVYRNDGGAFTDVGGPLAGLLNGTLDWGDLDGDGDLDLVLAGGAIAPTIIEGVTRVYRNDGGAFRPLDLGLHGVVGVRAVWCDVDADGDLDLTVVGASSVIAETTNGMRIYRNDGGTLTEVERFGSVIAGDALWYDYNSDGLIDFLQMGRLGGRPEAFLFRQSLDIGDGEDDKDAQ